VGSIDLPAAVDEASSIVVAGASGIVQLSSMGRREWSIASGGSPPVSGPILTSNGRRLVLTANGELLSISSTGQIRARVQLPANAIRSAAPALPLPDGGALLALGGELIQLEANHGIFAKARVNDEVRSIVHGPSGFLIVTEFGDIHRWLPPKPPVRLGEFGGHVSDGAVLGTANQLTAVVDRAKVVDFKLTTATRHLRIPPSGLVLQGPPAITAQLQTRVLSSDGLLLGHDLRGQETLRVALDTSRANNRRASADWGSAAPLVVDKTGWVAFALPSAELGVVSPSGEVRLARGAGCADPISLVPAGQRQLLLACRSGQVWMVGDTAKDSSEPKREAQRADGSTNDGAR
jgi:hypothetical protein